MRSNDAQDLSSDFEPAPLAVGPSGIEMTPQAKILPPPPRLCEQGPCAHYHTLVVQLDVEAPLGQGVEIGGRVEGRPEHQPFYESRKHYCYPDVGIEIELGATPVFECNRWDPKPDFNYHEERRKAYMESPAGQAYAREIAEWHAQRAAEGDPYDPIHGWIETNMRDGDEVQLYRINAAAGEYVREQDTPLIVADRGAAETWSVDTVREEFGADTYILYLGRYAPGWTVIATLSVEVI